MERLLAMEPEWDRLLDGDYTETLFHLSGTVRGQKSADIVANYQPKSVEDLAVVLALLRPRKNHLIGCSWDKIKSEIWEPGDESLYGFKKSHALSYSMVVVVQMNLRTEKELKDSFELVVLPSSSTANIV
jgi:DNA polymerase III alpha subunit